MLEFSIILVRYLDELQTILKSLPIFQQAGLLPDNLGDRIDLWSASPLGERQNNSYLCPNLHLFNCLNEKTRFACIEGHPQVGLRTNHLEIERKIDLNPATSSFFFEIRSFFHSVLSFPEVQTDTANKPFSRRRERLSHAVETPSIHLRTALSIISSSWLS